MSIQTDSEALALTAMEVYSANHNLSGEETLKIFHDNQVFEKILLQHEYLHQVSIEEACEYIEKVIQEASKKLTLYHGSSFDFTEIDLSKSHNRRDFGRGFYTTLLYSQSKEWAYRQALRFKKEKYYIYEYAFCEKSDLKVKRFDMLSEEWLEFIKENRLAGGLTHGFDVVIGPVADDNTMETVQLYIAGVLTAPEAVERLRHNNVNNQVSFHSEKALECLKFVRREEYDSMLHI